FLQYGMTPVSFSTSVVSTITIASQGQPSRNEPSGPLLVHFLHPMHNSGSTWMRPKGGWSSSGTQNMQSSTGQYSTQAGEPAQPVQHSLITANSLGFFLRGVAMPLDLGSYLNSSGTKPGATGWVTIDYDYNSGCWRFGLSVFRSFSVSAFQFSFPSFGLSGFQSFGVFRCLFLKHANMLEGGDDTLWSD